MGGCHKSEPVAHISSVAGLRAPTYHHHYHIFHRDLHHCHTPHHRQQYSSGSTGSTTGVGTGARPVAAGSFHRGHYVVPVLLGFPAVVHGNWNKIAEALAAL